MGLFLDESILLAVLDFYEQSGSQFAIWDGWGEKPGFAYRTKARRPWRKHTAPYGAASTKNKQPRKGRNLTAASCDANMSSHELNLHHSKALYKAATLLATFSAFFSSLGNAQLREGLLSPFAAPPPPPAKVSFAFPFADFCGG